MCLAISIACDLLKVILMFALNVKRLCHWWALVKASACRVAARWLTSSVSFRQALLAYRDAVRIHAGTYPR